MLTNGIEEYQMTPRDWEGRGCNSARTDPVLFEGFIPATLHSFICLYLCEKVIVGRLSEDPRLTQLVNKSLPPPTLYMLHVRSGGDMSVPFQAETNPQCTAANPVPPPTGPITVASDSRGALWVEVGFKTMTDRL